MPAVLLDCDGVIVDNVAFEEQVTSRIIHSLADARSISERQAKKCWMDELIITKGHVSWYDYAFHCTRLGLDGSSLARSAHIGAANLLRLVDGAEDTLLLLQDHGLEVGIVTDATSWVVEFKLDALNLHTMSFIFTSDQASATKASRAYWEVLADRFEYFGPQALVDNRHINLMAASSLLPDMGLVQFERDEHVMTLRGGAAPLSRGSADGVVTVVRNHMELRKWITENIS